SSHHRRMKKVALFVFASMLFSMAIVSASEPALGKPYSYKTFGDKSLELHVIEPAPTANDAPRMAIVFFHGGGWVGGKVTQFQEQAQHFASRGAVCFLIQYRFAPRDG